MDAIWTNVDMSIKFHAQTSQNFYRKTKLPLHLKKTKQKINEHVKYAMAGIFTGLIVIKSIIWKKKKTDKILAAPYNYMD